MPAGVRISVSVTTTVAYPKPHGNSALTDILTVTLDVAMAVKVLVLSAVHVDNSINGHGAATLCTVERKVPSFAAFVTVVDPESSVPINTKGRVAVLLGENAVLLEQL